MTSSKDTCRKEAENSVLVDSVTESNDRGNSTPASAEMKTSGNTLKDSTGNIKKNEESVGDKDSDMSSSQPGNINGSDTDSSQPSDQSKSISCADACATKKPNAVKTAHPKVLVPVVPTKEHEDDISDEELYEMLREVWILMGIDGDPKKEDATDKNTDKSMTSSSKLTEKKFSNKDPECDNQNEPMEVDDILFSKELSEITEDKKSGKCSGGVVKDTNNNNTDMDVSDYEETEEMEVDSGYNYRIIQDTPTFPWFKEHVKIEKPEPMIVEYLEHRTPPQVKNCPQPMEWTTFRPRVIDTPFTMPKFHQKSQDKFTQPVPPRSPRRGSEQGFMANMYNAAEKSPCRNITQKYTVNQIMAPPVHVVLNNVQKVQPEMRQTARSRNADATSVNEKANPFRATFPAFCAQTTSTQNGVSVGNLLRATTVNDGKQPHSISQGKDILTKFTFSELSAGKAKVQDGKASSTIQNEDSDPDYLDLTVETVPRRLFDAVVVDQVETAGDSDPQREKQNHNTVVAEVEREEYLERERFDNIRSNVAAGIAEIRAQVEAMEKEEMERRADTYSQYSGNTRERRGRRDADRRFDKQNGDCYRDMNNAKKRRCPSPANNRELERDVGHVKRRRINAGKSYDREVGGCSGRGTDKSTEERQKPKKRLEKLKYVVNEENQLKRCDIEKEDIRSVSSCQRYGRRWRRTTRKQSRWD